MNIEALVLRMIQRDEPLAELDDVEDWKIWEAERQLVNQGLAYRDEDGELVAR